MFSHCAILSALLVFPAFGQTLSRLPQPEIGTWTAGRFHHLATGTEFSFPADWTFQFQGQSSGGGQAASFAHPLGPRIDAFVWMKPHTLDSADIVEKLRSVIDYKAGQREGEGAIGYKMLRDTIEHKTVGGQQAVSIQAQYGPANRKMIEYNTWVISEKTHIYIRARARAQDIDSAKIQIDQLLATFSVP